MEVSAEGKTLVTILRHIGTVRQYLLKFVQQLEYRREAHDISKLSLEEFQGFIEVNQIAREHPYGSEEYKNSLKGNKVIQLHFSRNSHHPEFYPNGIEDMSIFDIIEMTIDWLSAAKTYGQTSFEDSLAIQTKRFNLSEKHLWLIKLIAKELE